MVSIGLFFTVVTSSYTVGKSQPTRLHSQAGVTTTTLKLISRIAVVAVYESNETISLRV